MITYSTDFDEVVSHLNEYINYTLTNFLATIVVITAVFFVIKSLFKSKYVDAINKQFRFFMPILSIGLGVLVSTYSFVYTIERDWNYLFLIVAIFVLGFNINAYLIMGMMPILIVNLWNVYFSTPDAIAYVQCMRIGSIVFLSLILINSIFFMYLKWKNNFMYLTFNIFAFGTIAAIVFSLEYTNTFGIMTAYEHFRISADLIVCFIISLLCFAFCKLFIRFIEKTQKLSEDVTYKHGFIMQKYANEQISSFILRENINQAYIIKFNIYGLEPFTARYGSSYATTIKTNLIQEIKKGIDRFSPLYYLQGDDNEYFAMIPIDDIKKVNLGIIKKGNELKNRKADDHLKVIEDVLNGIATTYNRNLQSSYQVNVHADAAIYGINNNYFEINKSLVGTSVIKTIFNENIITYVDSSMDINREYNIKNRVLEELNEFTPNDIEIVLSKSEHTLGNHHVYESNAVFLQRYLLNKQDIYNLSSNRVTKAAIVCHVSAKSIKSFVKEHAEKNAVLIVDYPQYFLESESFNILDFISNIVSYEITVSQIILNILIDEPNFKQSFYDALNKITKNKIKLAFSNISKSNAELITVYKPCFISTLPKNDNL